MEDSFISANNIVKFILKTNSEEYTIYMKFVIWHTDNKKDSIVMMTKLKL